MAGPRNMVRRVVLLLATLAVAASLAELIAIPAEGLILDRDLVRRVVLAGYTFGAQPGTAATRLPLDAGPPAGTPLALLQDMVTLDLQRRTMRNWIFLVLATTLGMLTLLALVSAGMGRRNFRRTVREVLRGGYPSRSMTRHLPELGALTRRADASETAFRPTSQWSSAALRSLVGESFADAQVIVLANREPYIHEHRDDGTVELVRPASGVVTALDPVMQACSGIWVAHGAGSADREMSDAAGRLDVPPDNAAYRLRRVWLTEAEEQGYYYGFANEGLWPLCHLAHVRPSFRASDWRQYVSVNQRFADAVADEATRPDPVVLVQDYHFALAPRMIRERLPEALILAFWHIPWPNPERLGISPWREELLDGMLGANITGFHTPHHCNNFLDSVDTFLEARIDRASNAVVRAGNRTLVRPYPISIEWPFRAADGFPSADACRESIRQELGLPADAIIAVGVDRLDYTKGISERLSAVERLLERSPALRGRFTFIQLAAPSRTQIPAYHELNEEVRQAADRVNSRFGTGAYTPVVLRRGHHNLQAILRCFRAANVCYVSSLHDGMNLVAKEFVASREDEQGVLVLSSFAGAAHELPEALIVNPYDIEQASAALEAAVTMSPQEQAGRMRAMRRRLSEFNVYRWAARMLQDLATVRRQARFDPRPFEDSRAEVGAPH